MIDYGDWRNQPDYREGWQDKNKSSVVGMIRALDLTQKLPVIGEVSKKLHEGEDYLITGANRVLAPALNFESKTLGQADPIRQTLSKVDPERHKAYQDWWNNHGGDIALIAALTYATGGAAAGASNAGAPAASGGAGAAGGTAGFGAAGSAAITPAFQSTAIGAGAGATAGTTTGSLVGAGAITPAFASGAYQGVAGASGAGTLGTAGTAAATNAVTPALASLGGSPAGILSKAANVAKTANKYDAYRSNISKAYQPSKEKEVARQKELQLAEMIRNNQPDRVGNINKLTGQIVMNKYNRGFAR